MADRAIVQVWRELLNVFEFGATSVTYQLALDVLRRLPVAVTKSIHAGLFNAYQVGHKQAVDAVMETVPHELLLANPLREAVEPPGNLLLGFTGVKPSYLAYQLADPDTTDAERRSLFAQLIFPAPSEPTILDWLRQFTHPADWLRIGTDDDKRLPEDLAGQIATGFSLGKSAREVAKEIRPYLDGSRVRARRAARTFGMQVGHAGQIQAWQGLGDLLVGYQIHSAKVPSSRPWHKARDGEVYYVEPGPGQKGIAQCPHPPVEAEDVSERPPGTPRIAWNCLCWLTPVLRT